MSLSPPPAAPIEHLVQTHQRSLRHYLRYLGAPAASVDDLVQETFLATLRSDFTFTNDAAAFGWLRTVARRLLLQQVKSAARRGLQVELEAAEAAFAAHLGDDDGEARRDALRACLQQLPPRQLLALQLRYGEDAPLQRVAAALAVGRAGAESLLARLRQRLRECMQGRLQR